MLARGSGDVFLALSPFCVTPAFGFFDGDWRCVVRLVEFGVIFFGGLGFGFLGDWVLVVLLMAVLGPVVAPVVFPCWFLFAFVLSV